MKTEKLCIEIFRKPNPSRTAHFNFFMNTIVDSEFQVPGLLARFCVSLKPSIKPRNPIPYILIFAKPLAVSNMPGPCFIGGT